MSTAIAPELTATANDSSLTSEGWDDARVDSPVVTTVFAASRKNDAMLAALKASLATTPERQVKSDFWAAFIASKLYGSTHAVSQKMLDKATAVLRTPGKERQPEAAAAYNAAKVAWGRALRAAGHQTQEKPRGIRTPAKLEGKPLIPATAEVEKVTAPGFSLTLPTAGSLEEGQRFLSFIGAALSAWAEKSPDAVTPKQVKAIAAFRKAIEATAK